MVVVGRPDNGITLDMALEHPGRDRRGDRRPGQSPTSRIGFASGPGRGGERPRLAVGTGVGRLSVEDSTGDEADPLYAVDDAVERIRAARRAIDAAGGDTLLVARAPRGCSGAGCRSTRSSCG